MTPYDNITPQRQHNKRQSLLNVTEQREAKSKLTPETKCKVMAHVNPPKLYYTKENTMKTPPTSMPG